MTETANSVITDALQMIVVQASEAPIEQDEALSAIRALNRMMARFAAEGINLGYTVVDDLGDEITVAAGAIDGMVSNLAVALAPQYLTTGTPPHVAMLAVQGKNAMRNIAVTIGASEFPSTLPIGSGNEQAGYRDDHFYPDLQDTILAETGGSIALEEDTE